MKERRDVIKAQRERIRKALADTGPDETICLNGHQAETLVKWIEDMEERIAIMMEGISK